MRAILILCFVLTSIALFAQPLSTTTFIEFKKCMKELESELASGKKDYGNISKTIEKQLAGLKGASTSKFTQVQLTNIEIKTSKLLNEIGKINANSYNYTIKGILIKYSELFDLVEITDLSLDLVKEIKGSVDKSLGAALAPIAGKLQSVESTVKRTGKAVGRIENLLKNQPIEKTKYVTASVFADGLYSLAFSKIKYNDTTTTLFPRVYSAEFIFPINSQHLINPGFFGSAGFYYKRFVLQAGIGFLDTKEYHNISWKGSVDFLSEDEGLGITYSPLTGTGIKLSFRF